MCCCREKASLHARSEGQISFQGEENIVCPAKTIFWGQWPKTFFMEKCVSSDSLPSSSTQRFDGCRDAQEIVKLGAEGGTP